MKKLILLLLWMSTIQLLGIHIAKKPASPHSRQTLTTANFQISISPLQINTAGTMVLSTPGDYYLTDNLEFHPTQTPTATMVINITSSNVSLDLNSKEISQAPGNTTALVQAIVVDPGLTNIFIHNGAISGFSGAGIIVGASTENLSIRRVSVTNCGLAGIVIGYNPFDTGTYASVWDGQQQIPLFDPATPPTTFSKDILLDSVYVNGVSGYFSGSSTQYSNAIGIDLAYLQNFQVVHSLSNSNQYGAPDGVINSTTDPGGYYSPSRSGYIGCGMRMVGCQNGDIENCEVSDNAGWAGYGMLLHNCRSVSFYICEADHNIGNGDPVMQQALLGSTFDFLSHRDLGRAAGFMLQDSSGNHFQDCDSHDTLGNRQTAGFWIRRYYMLSSDSSVPSSSYYNPMMMNTQLDATCVSPTDYIDLHNILTIPTLPMSPSSIGSGYNIATTPQYIVSAGSNWNTFTHCHATQNSSTYLDGAGLIAQGGINNTFHEILSQSNVAGSGPSAYSPSGIADFDQGVGVWSLTEQPKYQDPFTDQLIEYGAGMILESTCLPLMDWNGTTVAVQEDGGGNILFLPTLIDEIAPGVYEYALLSWAEASDSVSESLFKDNFGSCVGTGVGLLLNGAITNIIKHNWLSSNHSCSTGTTASSSICADMPSGIGAQGGYGLLDMAANCTSLILENYAFNNQMIQPQVVLACTTGVSTVGMGPYIEGANYQVTYTDPNASFPVITAPIGDFSTFASIIPFTNIAWGQTFKTSCTSPTSNCSYVNRILVQSEPSVFIVG